MSTDKFSMRVRRGVTYNIAPALCVAAMSPATILLAFDILIEDAYDLLQRSCQVRVGTNCLKIFI